LDPDFDGPPRRDSAFRESNDEENKERLSEGEREGKKNCWSRDIRGAEEKKQSGCSNYIGLIRWCGIIAEQCKLELLRLSRFLEAPELPSI
jgi:hypothetical protein